jgi:ABC-type molybdate transport system substrate-binding protein
MAPPVRRLAIVTALGLTVALAGCGGEVQSGGGASPPPEQTQVQVTAEANEPFTLAAGRYKFAWTTECRGIDFTMTGAGTGFTYAKTSALPRFSAIVSNVEADTYTLVQADAECSDWTVTLDRVGS